MFAVLSILVFLVGKILDFFHLSKIQIIYEQKMVNNK